MSERHYQVRKEGSAHPIYRTNGATETQFDLACGEAMIQSTDKDGVWEVRYQGWHETAKDLLVAYAISGVLHYGQLSSEK